MPNLHYNYKKIGTGIKENIIISILSIFLYFSREDPKSFDFLRLLIFNNCNMWQIERQKPDPNPKLFYPVPDLGTGTYIMRTDPQT
jgi:hypothetical protein